MKSSKQHNSSGNKQNNSKSIRDFFSKNSNSSSLQQGSSGFYSKKPSINKPNFSKGLTEAQIKNALHECDKVMETQSKKSGSENKSHKKFTNTYNKKHLHKDDEGTSSKNCTDNNSDSNRQRTDAGSRLLMALDVIDKGPT